jgi:hypothetical protein
LALPFKEANIKGFTTVSPFKVSANFLTTDQALAFHWPSLLELNDDLVLFPWSLVEEQRQYLSGDTISTLLVMYMGPLPATPFYPLPEIPTLNILTQSII